MIIREDNVSEVLKNFKESWVCVEGNGDLWCLNALSLQGALNEEWFDHTGLLVDKVVCLLTSEDVTDKASEIVSMADKLTNEKKLKLSMKTSLNRRALNSDVIFPNSNLSKYLLKYRYTGLC